MPGAAIFRRDFMTYTGVDTEKRVHVASYTNVVQAASAFSAFCISVCSYVYLVYIIQ